MSALITDIRSEIEDPVSQPMSLVSLGLLVGLVMVFAVLWSRVLAHMTLMLREI